VTTEPLDIEDIPDFKSPPDWGIMRRLNKAKWEGIRSRVTEVESAVEQAMYVDLLLEITNLTAQLERSVGSGSLLPSPVAAGLTPNLELALIKVLAGKILDCEHGTTLISTVAEIMSELQ
tara:strand:+ start:3710 stop:4069 length:360 start_codon:yes stop_codon:yes gene_type:complete